MRQEPLLPTDLTLAKEVIAIPAVKIIAATAAPAKYLFFIETLLF